MESYCAARIPDDLPGGVYRTEPIAHVEDHLRWMRRCGRSDTTLKARRRALTRLAEYLGHDPATAALPELESWQDQLPSRNQVRHQTQLIRPYFAWLLARGHRADDPAALLAVPPKPKRLPRPIPEDRLMVAIEKAPRRELPWLLLAGWTGMRASDIAQLRRDRIHVDGRGHRYARVVGKHGIERDVAIPGWVWERVEPMMWPEGWCWRRERGPGRYVDPPTAQHVSQYCNEYLARLGFPDRLHSLRHRVASRTLDDTGNASTVQEVLGHSSLSQVQVYARVGAAARADAVERLPRPASAPPRPATRPQIGGAAPLALSESELDSHVASWLATYRSAATISGFRQDVRVWREWCAREGVRPHEARRSDAERYRGWLEGGRHKLRGGRRGKYAPATVVRKLNAASSWYRYLADEGLVPSNPFLRVTRPPLPIESSTPCLTRDEASNLIAAAEAESTLAAAVVWALLSTGLRVSELCEANLADLRDAPTGLHLTVVRKGGRESLVSIPGAAGDAMRAYLAERPSRSGSKALLLRNGLRLHRRRVHDMVVELCGQAGVTRVSAHGLRHTVATLLLDAGVSIWDVQAHMGHRHTATTLRYDRARRARAGAAAAKLVEVLDIGPVQQPAPDPLDLSLAG